MAFVHELCECPPDTCKKGVAPASDCVNRLSGTVESVRCEKCQGDTLHHNGECIRCQRLAASPKEQVGKVILPSRQLSPVTGTLSLTITLGGNGVIVTDKKQVAKILKILLED